MRWLLLAMLLLPCLGGAAARAEPAEAWPTRDIRIIVPFPPGDAADSEARRLASHYAEVFGVNFVVDNRPGVSGRMGTEVSARLAADGYTLIMTASGPLTLVPQILGAGYDPLVSFEPVLLPAAMPLLLLAPEGPAYARVQDLVLRARGQRRGLAACSTGIATPSHIAAVLFARTLDLDFVHVPYRGSYAAMTDVIAARCDMLFDNAASAGRHARAGRVRAVAITTEAPQTAWPGVPALEGVRLSTFSVLVAPGGTHRLIVSQLNDIGRRFLARPEERARILAEGGEPLDLAPSQIRSYLRHEIAGWNAILRGMDLGRD